MGRRTGSFTGRGRTGVSGGCPGGSASDGHPTMQNHGRVRLLVPLLEFSLCGGFADSLRERIRFTRCARGRRMSAWRSIVIRCCLKNSSRPVISRLTRRFCTRRILVQHMKGVAPARHRQISDLIVRLRRSGSRVIVLVFLRTVTSACRHVRSNRQHSG